MVLSDGPCVRRCYVPRDRGANDAGDSAGGQWDRENGCWWLAASLLASCRGHLLFESDTTPGNAVDGVVTHCRERR